MGLVRPSSLGLVITAVLVQALCGSEGSTAASYPRVVHGPWPDDAVARLEALMADAALPGLSVGIVDMRNSSDPILRTQHLGYARLGCIDPEAYENNAGSTCLVDEHTVFATGRISQLFVTAAVMKSSERGYVSLDEPVYSYLYSRTTGLEHRKTPSVWLSTRPMDRLKDVTLRHLLSHTACLRNKEVDIRAHMRPGDTTTYFRDYLHHNLVSLDAWVPGCTPGAHYTYSSVGVMLAAHILEFADPAVGLDFDTYYKSYLLPNLGAGPNAGLRLSDLVNPTVVAQPYGSSVVQRVSDAEYPGVPTSIVPTYREQHFSNRCRVPRNGSFVRNVSCAATLLVQQPSVSGSIEELARTKVGFSREYPQYGRLDYPATMLRLSCQDLAAFLAAQMGAVPAGGASPFLSQTSIQEMQQSHITDGDLPSERSLWGGLGWLREWDDHRSLYTMDDGADLPGVASLMSFDPLTQLGVVVLSNGNPSKTGDGALMTSPAPMPVELALRRARDYLLDWQEAQVLPPQAPRADVYGPNSTSLDFQLFHARTTSIDYKIMFDFGTIGAHVVEVNKGLHINLRYGSVLRQLFPQEDNGTVIGQITDLFADTPYTVVVEVATPNQEVVLSTQLSERTLPLEDQGAVLTSVGAPMRIQVQLEPASSQSDGLRYVISHYNLRVQDGVHLHLQWYARTSDALSGNEGPVSSTKLFPRTSNGVLEGQIDALVRQKDYTVEVDIVDINEGEWGTVVLPFALN